MFADENSICTKTGQLLKDFAETATQAGPAMVVGMKSFQPAGKATHFDCVRPPSISVSDYVARIHTYGHFSDSSFVLSLIYIDRVIQKNPDIILSRYNVHRYISSGIVS